MASSIEAYLLALTSTMGQGIQATPVSTNSSGTSAGGTETLDSVLGVYQFNAVAGRRYLATMNGLVGSGTAASLYEVRIRDSQSSSNPTNTSQILASSQWIPTASGGPGQATIPLGGSFIASTSGTHTLGMFSLLSSGTGNFTPISFGMPRELYVVDLGVF